MPIILLKPLIIVCRGCKWIILIFIKFIGLIGFYVPMFGETEYDPVQQYASISIDEQLEALSAAVKAGKIRFVGLSNETPYGLMKFIQVAEKYASHLKIVSLQNSYSLLCRTFDSAMAECCHHERISLLAYSPLAMGILSGKYFSPGGGPTDARLNLFKGKYSEGESRYNLSNKIIKAATVLLFCDTPLLLVLFLGPPNHGSFGRF
uniref:NADP-dependent oxidoreductase domain-containing protein n=1 Tax=Glycine max TaxID=3847 RepID=A0A0R0JWL7_SOYBN